MLGFEQLPVPGEAVSCLGSSAKPDYIIGLRLF